MKSSTFFDQVYDLVRQIPAGKVTTYGHIAEYLGSKKSARMVGWAMNASHGMAMGVPAHRVVNRNGLLTGKHHFGSPELMQLLLEKEGVKVVNDQIIDFEAHLWIPGSEV